MLSYLAAHNSTSSRHDNGISALRNDAQRTVEELLHVHCGQSKELLSQKKMQLSREFCNKDVKGHLIHLSPHYCKHHQKMWKWSNINLNKIQLQDVEADEQLMRDMRSHLKC